MKRGLGVRFRRKLGSVLKSLQRPQANLYVYSPVFVPIQGKPFFDALNNALIKVQLKVICLFLKMRRPLLWMENIRAADALDWFKHRRGVVYHVSDLFSHDRYVSNVAKHSEREARITEASDLIICVSKPLFEDKKKFKENVYYIPHGVDFDLFQAAVASPKPLDVVRDIPRPVVGYFGTMSALNDIETMEYCAENLPEVSFVFAGQITTGDYNKLQGMSNVHFLGRLPYEEIPHLCAGFDLCLLQWKMSDWIRSCNPLKMFEYMACGKPIVSVPIEEAMRYEDCISIAGDKEAFCQAIQWELENDTDSRRKKRVEVAASHSWAYHVERMCELIDKHTPGTGKGG